MNNIVTLRDKRLAEIVAFDDKDISDCPELTDEELSEFKPKHQEYFNPQQKRKAV